MIFYQLVQVHVANAIAIGEHKGLIAYVGKHTLQSPGSHSIKTSINQGNFERLCRIFMYLQRVCRKIDRNVGIVQKIVGEILLYHPALVAEADDKLSVAIGSINLHYVPQYRLSAYFNHRFWPQRRLFRNPGTPAACEYYYLHDDKYNR